MTSETKCWCGHHKRYHGGDSCTLCDNQQLGEPHPFGLIAPTKEVITTQIGGVTYKSLEPPLALSNSPENSDTIFSKMASYITVKNLLLLIFLPFILIFISYLLVMGILAFLFMLSLPMTGYMAYLVLTHKGKLNSQWRRNMLGVIIWGGIAIAFLKVAGYF